ncbi:unnamed protein product [Trichobilharzia regenti]|nr:unnamed protein product [Trichobilharzia regenti]
MLHLDPDRRLTAAQALAHRYFASYHDESDEPVAEKFDDPFQDDSSVTLDQLKGTKQTTDENSWLQEFVHCRASDQKHPAINPFVEEFAKSLDHMEALT